MVYLLGSDVHAAITTEHAVVGMSVVEGSGEVYPDNVLIGVLDATDNTANSISTTAAHNLSTGDPFMFTMDDASPSLALTLDGSAAATGTTYFAIKVDADDLKVASTYANAIAGTAMSLGGSIQAGTGVNTNLTRELGSNTLIKNRNWPQYDGAGRIDSIIGDTTTAEGIEQSTTDDLNVLTDLTSIDVTVGTTDEDVSYFGQRTALKTEIQNEVTVTFTKKKSDNKFSALFNKARAGVLTFSDTTKTAFDLDSATAISSTLPTTTTTDVNKTLAACIGSKPSINFGFRIHIMLKTGVEVMTLRNCCMTAYTTTVNADGVTEETIEFYGTVKPKVTKDAVGHVTATPEADL